MRVLIKFAAPMEKKSKQQELKHLEKVKDRLRSALEVIEDNIRKQGRDLKEIKEYLYENKTGMDRMEKFQVRQSVNQGAASGEEAVKRKKKINRLLGSPYFGRMDFAKDGSEEPLPLYIGIHSFFDEEKNTNIIYDWRAPVSGMFYDFGLGRAGYASPSGKVSGDISLKRQFRIRNGRMEYMLENSANVYDDILQAELSRSSGSKMKNIVATIQRDQNPVIRNEESHELIIQGVAGSGKTSIALHRIAFLLYRYKDSIKSGDILIISPNRVYSDYIANVLPELGEEKIPQTSMEEIAERALEGKYRFQGFFSQVSALLENSDAEMQERIRFKSTNEFISLLDKYLAYAENEYFQPHDLWVGKSLVPKWFIEEKYLSLHRLPVFKRFGMIATSIEENIGIYYKREVSSRERQQLLKDVKAMFHIGGLRGLYRDFYQWIGRPGFLKPYGRSGYEYSDIFPLVYIKLRFEGIEPQSGVKHLLIDEMQDYSPIQYAVISRLYPCKKTILGDSNQTVNPYGSSGAESIARLLPGADIVKLRRSYRSTYEITRLAQRVLADKDLIPVERYGEKPVIRGFESDKQEVSAIIKSAGEFSTGGLRSFGIVCRTERLAKLIHRELRAAGIDAELLDSESTLFTQGIVVTAVHMAKGLEFDQVLVPGVNSKNYHSESDRRLLYIACTRAMHKLQVFYTRELSPFLR